MRTYLSSKIKCKLTIGVLILLLCIDLCSAGRIDTVLDSEWSFYRADVANAASLSFDDSGWSKVNVPHTYNALDGQDGGNDYYRGPAWYRKSISIPADHSGKRIYIFFEAVAKAADVYCNGVLVGRHEGAYAAFCYDITEYVNFGQDNLLAVRADNSGITSLPIAPLSGDFTQWGGICRQVRLIVTDPVHISLLNFASPGVYLTQTNVSELSADVTIKTMVRNANSAGTDAYVRNTVFDAEGNVVTVIESSTELNSGESKVVAQDLAIDNPHLWDALNDPYVYKVITEVFVNGQITDTMEQPLGLRYYTVDVNNGLMLNGHYYDLRGVAIHEDREDKGRAISDADREQDIDIILDMGCTFIRLSHYQHAEKIYDLADESGLVLWTEIPFVNAVNGIDSAAFDSFKDSCHQQLKELIYQNYNHPSILFWGLFNEITLGTESYDTEPLVESLQELAKSLDPTRLTTAASYYPWDDAKNYYTDTIAYNRYYGWYNGDPSDIGPIMDGYLESRSDIPHGVSEYGAGASIEHHEEYPAKPVTDSYWHPEEYQSYYHELHWKQMKDRPFIWCKTIWNGFDFGIDSRSEGDRDGINDKGMVTRDRTVKKDAFYWYKANWSKEPMVYITSRRFSGREDACPQYVKVYSNCEQVELFINGVSMGKRRSSDCIFTWESNIHLQTGVNVISAIGITDGQKMAEDSFADTADSWMFSISKEPSCEYMLSIGCGCISDFTGPEGVRDCEVDNYDFADMASQWMDNYIETVNPADPGANGLVAYYPLDGNYNDSTGNHNATEVSGGGELTFVSAGSHSGQTLDFDGASALQCGDSSLVDLTEGGAVSVWVKSDGETDSWACVLAKGLSSWRIIRNNQNSTLSFHFNPASGASEFQANGSISVIDGKWHHVLAEYTGSEIDLYIDGKLDASTVTGSTDMKSNTDLVYIGSRTGRLSDRSWNGYIDEVKIYDRALTPAERLWLCDGAAYQYIPEGRLADTNGDGVINFEDFMVFVHWWISNW